MNERTNERMPAGSGEKDRAEEAPAGADAALEAVQVR